jgi:hypothetical protein
LNACPNGLSIGQPKWHAEHGIPYFRANAGRGRKFFPGIREAVAGPLWNRNAPANKIPKSKYEK